MKGTIIYVNKCSKCSKVTPVCKMVGYEDFNVCQQCYEDTLLKVSAVDYYILQENMKPLLNLPLDSQVNSQDVTTSTSSP